MQVQGYACVHGASMPDAEYTAEDMDERNEKGRFPWF
jgi:hypothetical protein